jgi:hypothetical protein
MKYFNKIVIVVLLWICVAATKDEVKNVLIIGDSISMGYTPFVKKALAPNVNVEHNRGNGGSTRRGCDSVEVWSGSTQWDVIVFNFGLHDMVHKDSLGKYNVNGKVTVTLDEYRKNLKQIVATLRQTTARLIFINTTVVPEKADGRMVEDPARYNKVAEEVMKENGIKVLDLYTPSLTIHPDNSKPANVHYTDKGYEMLAEYVAKTIKSSL